MEYKFSEIEEKIKQFWEKENIYYTTDADSGKPKYYVLDMFPYPSGAGLHVGHPLGYIASDIYARYKRMKGFNVLHPMGYDSFGLPAEQYAIQTGQHPAITTEQNIATFRKQMDQLGFSFDWSREVRTSDPKFYKWTQWIFILLFHSWYNNATNKAEAIENLVKEFEQNGNMNVKAATSQTEVFTADEWKGYSAKQQSDVLLNYRIAYIADSWVNWCAALGTVLANDEVKDGVSERGGYPVERKLMKQWSLRITAYAERLLKGLDELNWSDSIKEAQRNWIGKSEGSSVRFELAGVGGDNTPLLRRGAGGEDEKTDDDSKLQAYLTGNVAIAAELLKFGKENRKSATPAEELLWSNLRDRKLGDKFKRQHPIGNFIVDFVCLSKKLIIELDGEGHKENKEYDILRTNILNELGYKVIRFWNDEFLKDAHSGLERIRTELARLPDSRILTPGPSPKERGGASDTIVRISIEVFTTRPDTIFGVTFLTLAPEHELINQITPASHKEEVTKYVAYARNRSERERMSDVKKITGQFTGAYAIHPFTGKQIPIWIGEYVLASYGTGAVMGVPGHDSRDYAFARYFNLPIIEVVKGGDISVEAFEGEGQSINSSFLDGLNTTEAKKKVIDEIEKKGIGQRKINFKLRDAIFGRQRYWGEPIPIYYDKEGIPHTVDEDDLPLVLPEVDKYLPTEDGEPPLARASNWTYKPHPNGSGAPATPLPGRGAGGEVPKNEEEPNLPHFHTANPNAANLLVDNARANRKDQTEAEELLWSKLRDKQLGAKFRRQHYIGNYITDFVALNEGLVIELDGEQHKEQKEYDKERTNYLNGQGFTIIRFWNEEVIKNTEAVLSKISSRLDSLKHLTPNPSPRERGTDAAQSYPLETTTMPGWAGSSWYYLRYEDPNDSNALASKEKIDYWKNIDFYIGGAEHSTGHLIYFRFWTKFLHDLGIVPFEEPAKRLVNQGMIQGVSQFMNMPFGYEPKVNRRNDQEVLLEDILFIPDKGEYVSSKQFIPEGVILQSPKGQALQLRVYFSDDIAEHYRDVRTSSIRIEAEFSESSLLNVPKAINNSILLDTKGWYLIFICSDGIWVNDKFYEKIPNGKGKFSTVSEVEKMSKSKYNVVNPDDIVSKYGADCFRLYEMFLGPLELSKPWDTKGIDGVSRFLRKLWRLFYDDNGKWLVTNDKATNEELKPLHKTIKKVEEDMERLSFNTSVSSFMICVNTLTDLKCHKAEVLKDLLLIMTPLAPFTTDFLWRKMEQEGSIVQATFPKYREELLVENVFEYPVAINGKTKTKIELALDLSDESIQKEVLALESVQKFLEGKTPKKVIVVKGRMVNVVV